MTKVPRTLTGAILSMSLLTVMAGAAIAPALGSIKEHFSSSPDILIQLIVSIPALFIILTNLLFPALSRTLDTRTIALVGLTMYVVFGSGAFFVGNIVALLLLRALLGVSVGLIMPLSTGLLSFYFPPEKLSSLMGLSAAMNQLGGVVATLLAGLLCNISWNCAFLVYLLGLVAVLLVLRFLPAERLMGKGSRISPSTLLRFHPSVVGMLLVMIIFFVYPTNFALVARRSTSLSGNAITLIMVGLDVVAFLVGLVFGRMMAHFPRPMKYIAPSLFLLGYAVMAFFEGAAALVAGSVLVGLANGVGVPYLNTIASIKGGRDAATTVMPLLSAALYLGQFVSPFVVLPLGRLLFPGDGLAPFKVAVLLCGVLLAQVYLTRSRQALPPSSVRLDD